MFYFTSHPGWCFDDAGNDVIKLDQWNQQGLFGNSVDNLFTAVDGQSVASIFGGPVHVVIVSNSAASESHLYINGVLSGTWGGSIPLSGQVKVWEPALSRPPTTWVRVLPCMHGRPILVS